jgi:hypothetical protein
MSTGLGAHISEQDLALLAGDDLGWWARWRMRRHVGECARCSQKLADLEQVRADVSALSAIDLPVGLDWNRMEREMRANIHLAVDCGDAIRRVPQFGKPLDWRAAMALAALTAVVLTGWFLGGSRKYGAGPWAAVESGSARVSASGAGVELRTGSMQSLTLLAPRETSYSSYAVDAHGAVSARSVDESTGQVTIANVSFE